MKAKGRAVGVPNYKNDLLINVIEAILPDGAIQSKLVATRYKEVSGEVEERDSHDIKRHFTTNKNLCDNGRKVTGSAAPKPSVARCQEIWRKILKKSSATNCGGGSPSDGESSDSDSGSEYNGSYDDNVGESASSYVEETAYNPYDDEDNTQFEENHYEQRASLIRLDGQSGPPRHPFASSYQRPEGPTAPRQEEVAVPRQEGNIQQRREAIGTAEHASLRG